MMFKISPSTETNLRTLAVFAGILTLVGFLGSMAAGTAGIYASIIATAAISGAILWFSREVAMWLMGAKEIKPGELHEGFDLKQIVENLKDHPEIQLSTMPKVCIIESDMLNAFATGRDRDHAAIAITRGLLKKANDKAEGDADKANAWITAIWCHELGHVVNRDIATKTVVTILASSVRILSESIYESRRKNEQESQSRKNNNTNAPGILQIFGEYFLFYALLPFTGTLLTLCLSRTREFAADEMAHKCGYNQSLQEAFQTLFADAKKGSGDSPHMEALSAMMCASMHAQEDNDEYTASKQSQPWYQRAWQLYRRYTATHPSMEERVERLARLAESPKAKI